MEPNHGAGASSPRRAAAAREGASGCAHAALPAFALVLGCALLALPFAAQRAGDAAPGAAVRVAPAAPADAAEPAAPPGDGRPHVTSAVREGIRFAPDTIRFRTAQCAPFAMDPDPAVAARLWQQPLTVESARALAAAEGAEPAPPGATSRCSIRACREGDGKQMLAAQDVCWFNRTLYLLGGGGGGGGEMRSGPGAPPPLPLHAGRWGSVARPRHFAYRLAEARSADDVPAPHRVWLGGTWALVTPHFRFGIRNVFHALLEEVGSLTRALRCAREGVGPGLRLLLGVNRQLLRPSAAGRMWELAADGAPSYFVHPAAERELALCFRRAHVEAWLETAARHGQRARLSRACEGAHARSGGGAHAWEGWPKPNGSVFRGPPDIVAAAHRRLRLPPPPEHVGRVWRAPRVTIVHRLRARRILNIDYLAEALRDEGMAVTVASLECMPLEAQVGVVANSSTLLGVHGAGLTLGYFTPRDAAVLELRTAPCAEEARGVPYQMRSAARIVPAPRSATMPARPCPPPWKYNSNEHDAVVDIAAVLKAIRELDPVARRLRAEAKRTAAPAHAAAWQRAPSARAAQRGAATTDDAGGAARRAATAAAAPPYRRG